MVFLDFKIRGLCLSEAQSLGDVATIVVRPGEWLRFYSRNGVRLLGWVRGHEGCCLRLVNLHLCVSY